MLGPIGRFVDSADFFVPEMKSTPHSTIIAHQQKRGILKLESEQDRSFFEYLRRRLADLEALGFSPWIKAVMVGHVAPDRWPENAGRCTEEVLTSFSEVECFKFANFGESQNRLGYDRWKKQLQNLDCFEANLGEMRGLMSAPGDDPKPLRDIIKQLIADGVTALITLDRFGAVGTFKGDQRIVMAWPFELKGIIDTTGRAMRLGQEWWPTRAHKKSLISMRSAA